MNERLSSLRSWLPIFLCFGLVAPAAAYPGGTGSFQTDAAPFCAVCHSSRTAEVLSGAGERADKEVAERKHIAVVLSGKRGYEDLSETDRNQLAEQIRALDNASTVSLEAPESVSPGQVFTVKVVVTGGGGPVVGVALVDQDHRWYARPAPSAGWTIAAPPTASSADGTAEAWLAKRPEASGRNLSYLNFPLSSDPAAGTWGRAEAVFTLRAPERVGALPLAAAYFYGTEKSTILGYKTNAVGWKEVRGGLGGGSGRVMFTPVKTIQVQ